MPPSSGRGGVSTPGRGNFDSRDTGLREAQLDRGVTESVQVPAERAPLSPLSIRRNPSSTATSGQTPSSAGDWRAQRAMASREKASQAMARTTTQLVPNNP